MLSFDGRDQSIDARSVGDIELMGVGVRGYAEFGDGGRASRAQWAREVLRATSIDVEIEEVPASTWQRASTADLTVVHEALETNLFGVWRVTLALLPLLRRSEHGRIVNVSSGAGSLTQMGAGTPGYSTSKAALNALTRMLAAELRADRILVNSVDPGWVATDMGGPGGGPVADGAAGILWAANLPDSGPSGGFFYDTQPVPW